MEKKNFHETERTITNENKVNSEPNGVSQQEQRTIREAENARQQQTAGTRLPAMEILAGAGGNGSNNGDGSIPPAAPPALDRIQNPNGAASQALNALLQGEQIKERFPYATNDCDGHVAVNIERADERGCIAIEVSGEGKPGAVNIPPEYLMKDRCGAFVIKPEYRQQVLQDFQAALNRETVAAGTTPRTIDHHPVDAAERTEERQNNKAIQESDAEFRRRNPDLHPPRPEVRGEEVKERGPGGGGGKVGIFLLLTLAAKLFFGRLLEEKRQQL